MFLKNVVCSVTYFNCDNINECLFRRLSELYADNWRNFGNNCSQLVWCAYRQTSGVDLDSDGTWFVSPSDMKDSEFTFIIWSY